MTPLPVEAPERIIVCFSIMAWTAMMWTKGGGWETASRPIRQFRVAMWCAV